LLINNAAVFSQSVQPQPSANLKIERDDALITANQHSGRTTLAERFYPCSWGALKRLHIFPKRAASHAPLVPRGLAVSVEGRAQHGSADPLFSLILPANLCLSPLSSGWVRS